MKHTLPKFKSYILIIGAFAAISGNLFDLILNNQHLSIVVFNGLNAFFAMIILILYFFKLINAYWGNIFIVYSNLLNVVFSLIYNANSSDIEMQLLRLGMLLALLIFYAGFALNRKHSNLIGLLVIVIIITITIYSQSTFLIKALPLYVIILVSFIVGENYILKMLDDYLSLQHRLIEDLQSRNKILSDQKKTLDTLNKTKDKIFSVMAHDLRAPLNGILGFAQLLEENLTKSTVNKSMKYLAIINNSAQKINILLEDLLNWGQIQTGQVHFNPNDTNLLSLINEVRSYLEGNAALKHISITCEVDDGLMVSIDKNMMQSVIRNLVSNAIKFTPYMGSVKISALKLQEQIQISVSDTGVGMDKDTLGNLFKDEAINSKFGTLNEKGSGLGLVICRQYVDIHRGSISVTSTVGQGSVFTILLPL